jgi:hypothetical protein
MIGCQGGGEEQSNLVLLQEIAGSITGSGLGAAVCQELEPECCTIVVAGLLGVADIELDEVGPIDREGVGGLCLGGSGTGLHGASAIQS